MTNLENQQFMYVAGATIVAAGITGIMMLCKTVDTTKEKVEDMIASPPPPEYFELPPGTQFGSFKNRRGDKIHTMTLARSKSRDENSNTPPPKAIAVCLHGLADHSSRPCYGRLYSALSEAGVDVYAMDHHGHGLSEAPLRGYCDKFTHYIDDVDEFCQRHVLKDDEENSAKDRPPFFLVGQSMGALIAAHTSLRLAKSKIPVTGLVVTSPAFGVDMDLVLKIQNFFGSILNALVPKAKLVDAVRVEDLTHDVSEQERFTNDVLINHGNTRIRTAICIKEGMDTMAEGNLRSDVNFPVLVLQGTSDATTSISSSLDFFANVSTKPEHKRFAKLTGLYHEVYNEPERAKAIDMIVKFVSSGGVDLPSGQDGETPDGVIELNLS